MKDISLHLHPALKIQAFLTLSGPGHLYFAFSFYLSAPQSRKRKKSPLEQPAVGTVTRVEGEQEWENGLVPFCCVCCAFSKISLSMPVRFTERMDLQEAKRWETLWPGNKEAWSLGATHWNSGHLVSKTENFILASTSCFH